MAAVAMRRLFSRVHCALCTARGRARGQVVVAMEGAKDHLQGKRNIARAVLETRAGRKEGGSKHDGKMVNGIKTMRGCCSPLAGIVAPSGEVSFRTSAASCLHVSTPADIFCCVIDYMIVHRAHQ